MIAVLAALIFAALYSGGMYVRTWLQVFEVDQRQRRTGTMPLLDVLQWRRDAQLVTFHLGLCFILSVGFIGLILK